MKTKRFIGITGGIGSGKSTVSSFWSTYAELPLINIDLLCRKLLDVEESGWVALKANISRNFFEPDGGLDRCGLRSAIFNDAALRQEVDRLIHPLAFDLLLKETEDMEGLVLVDVPLLFEAGWEYQFKRTVVVYADQQTCCRRVAGRDKILPGDAVKAISAQIRIEEKAMLADHVVDNRYCWLITRGQVSHLAELIRSGLAG